MILNDCYREITNKIEIVQKAHSINDGEIPLHYFYRGHACGSWKFIPSIVRVTGVTESSVISNAMESKDWKIECSLFENIAHLQHYGTPTRFLDYTTDIDIALYFACEKHMDEDGEIQICPYSETDVFSPNVQQITELALLSRKVSVYDFCKKLMDEYPSMGDNSYWSLKQLGANILSSVDHGFMIVCPEDERQRLKTWNPRIFNQKGAFFIFGNKTDPPNVSAMTTEVERSFILPEIADTPKALTEAVKIPIPKETKPHIINALAEKGITKSYVYPD